MAFALECEKYIDASKKAMYKIFKKHLVLIVGIFLPVFLTLLFGIVSLMPTLLVKPPQCDLLYLISPYPHDGVTLETQNSKLKIWITPAVIKGTLPMPRLFLFDVKAKISIEIPLKLPHLPKQTSVNQKELLNIPALEDLQIDPNQKSKDGYKATFFFPTDNGLTPFAFLNSHKRNFTITKDKNVIHIFDEANNSYDYKFVKFIGWILPKAKSEVAKNVSNQEANKQ